MAKKSQRKPQAKQGYIDGFVLVVPKKKVEDYKRMSRIAEKVWRKHGALDYKECIGDDLQPDMQGMAFLPFPKLTKITASETVFFSYIVYKSRAHRDQVNAKVMKDSMMNEDKWKDKPMPFDMKRMSYAGFKVVVGA